MKQCIKFSLRIFLWGVCSITFLIVGFFTYLYLERFILEPSRYVVKGDKDTIYERIEIMKEKLDEQEFNSMMIQLMDTSNIDFLSTNFVSRYADDNSLCFLLPYMRTKHNYFMTFPEDSIIIFEYRFCKHRGGVVNDPDFLKSFFKRVSSLEEKCAGTGSS